MEKGKRKVGTISGHVNSHTYTNLPDKKLKTVTEHFRILSYHLDSESCI